MCVCVCVCMCVCGQSQLCTRGLLVLHLQIEKDLADKLGELADMRQQVSNIFLLPSVHHDIGPTPPPPPHPPKKAKLEHSMAEALQSLQAAKGDLERQQVEHTTATCAQEQKISCLALELEATKRAMELADSASRAEKV